MNHFTLGSKIRVNDTMQSGYEYILTEEAGENFHSEFNPHFSPAEMLELGEIHK
jgi:hypothetical protein